MKYCIKTGSIRSSGCRSLPLPLESSTAAEFAKNVEGAHDSHEHQRHHQHCCWTNLQASCIIGVKLQNASASSLTSAIRSRYSTCCSALGNCCAGATHCAGSCRGAFA